MLSLLSGAVLGFSSLPENPTSYSFIINSCGDVKGPRMQQRVKDATGKDLGYGSTTGNAQWYSQTWDYMSSLKPDDVFLLGDNVYNDGIADWSHSYHPFGTNTASSMYDAHTDYLKIHGLLADDGSPGPLFHSYLDILTDKMHDGFVGNEAFRRLRTTTGNGIHMHWDDHDYLTNDPSNPHFMHGAFRAAAIDAITGYDKAAMRFPHDGEKGIERSWTKTFNNKGKNFVVRFIMLDEETTHTSGLGMSYVYDETSPSGFKPVQTANPSMMNADPAFFEDFESPKRAFFGANQIAWLVEELKKPADLRLVFNGGPNFEIEYSYASLTDFPGAKRLFVEALRESKAEKVVFFGGDSHATYVTKVPDLVGYPLYTIIGSGQTQGLSYDRYVGYWGDISHRHLVAAGSNNKGDSTASFAEVELTFDPEPMLTFKPHLADDVAVEGAETGISWGPWREQTAKNPTEPWEGPYSIKINELVNKPNEAVDHGKFVPETIYMKYKPPSTDVKVMLTLINAKNFAKEFTLKEGASWSLCGAGYYGLCKDLYGSFTYAVPTTTSYTPSLEARAMSEWSGFVGDQLKWKIRAYSNADNSLVDTREGEITLKIRNNILLDDGTEDNCSPTHYALSGYGCTGFISTQVSYGLVRGPSIGVPISKIIAEPDLYGGHKVPVKGFNFDTGSFDNALVQEKYILQQAGNATDAELSSLYLQTYYPSVVP